MAYIGYETEDTIPFGNCGETIVEYRVRQIIVIMTTINRVLDKTGKVITTFKKM